MTLQLINRRSLTDKQIKDSFDKFNSISKLLSLGKSPQITKKTESGYVSFSLNTKSKPYKISTPKISISKKQYCKNLENVKTVEISVHNCNTCSGSDSAEITSRKYSSLETILTDAFAIWHKSYKENLIADQLLVEDEKNLKKLKKLFNYSFRKFKTKQGWNNTRYFVGKRNGSVSTDDDHQSRFEIRLENVSYTDMNRLSKILDQFLKEDSL